MIILVTVSCSKVKRMIANGGYCINSAIVMHSWGNGDFTSINTANFIIRFFSIITASHLNSISTRDVVVNIAILEDIGSNAHSERQTRHQGEHF